ncbi:MAG: hypothetical protein KW788_03510 [Candidatus Doudnabacteria bacterium]|nr:hypothetical protein [Candidatus Doudnabacteria bacterium]
MNLKKICPICAVVVITWTAMLIWMWTGHNVDKTILAILMGMSAGAIGTKYGQNMIWKTLMVILSVPAVWYVTKDQPGTAAIFLGLIVLPSIYFNTTLNPRKGVPQADKFKDCC